MARETKYTANKRVTLTPELEKAIDEFRFSRRLKSETEALRLLIEMGLARANETKTPEQMVTEARFLLAESARLQMRPIALNTEALQKVSDPAELSKAAEALFSEEGKLRGLGS